MERKDNDLIVLNNQELTNPKGKVKRVRKTQNERMSEILNNLKGRPAPRKSTLASRLNISLSTLNKYLSKLKKNKFIAYQRSTKIDGYLNIPIKGRTFVIYKKSLGKEE